MVSGQLRAMQPRILVTLGLTLLTLAPVLSGQVAPSKRPDAAQLAPYVPTPQDVVDRMLALAGVGKNDVIYDLGCGDGRIPITAARRFGARGVGGDIDPQRIKEANANATAAGLAALVSFKLQDAMKTDVTEATVVTLYLLSASNLKLRPILTRQLKPGARIVSHSFGMGDWRARKRDFFKEADGRAQTLYLWRTDGTIRQ